MDDVFERNGLFLSIAQDELIEHLKRILRRILRKAFQAVQLYIFWTYIEAYHDKLFCLHAILHAANIFHMTFDRNGSIFLLAINIVIVLMSFYVKSSLATVFLMTILSTFFVPVDDFLWKMTVKSYIDVLISYNRCPYVFQIFSLTKEVASTTTDFGILALYVYYLRIHLHNSIEDSVLFLILMCLQVVFCLKLFTELYVTFIATLTLLYIYLKSQKFECRHSVFTMTPIWI